MREESRTAEQKIGGIASHQHGNVTRRQLLGLGISSSAIGRRVASGALLAKHLGVYRVGHLAPSVEADYFAAVAACGDGSFLSGPAASYMYGLLRGSAPPPEVTTRLERRVPGVVTRRSRHLEARDTTVYRQIPMTTVPRTLVDLAAVLDFDDLVLACHEANVRHRVTPERVETSLARKPNAPGAARLRHALRGDVNVTLSPLERRFISLIGEAGLPSPVTNQRAGTRRVDCRWPEHRLTVELDSYRYHNSRHAWENDRRREREAHARGDDFRRYTYGDVYETPGPMLRELREPLSPRRRPD